MKIKLQCVFAFLLLCAGQLYSQQINARLDSFKLVKPGAVLTLVSSQFKFTEGPAVDKQGNIYFTDQPNDKIWKYGVDGKLSLFMDKTGRSNGLYFDRQGRLVACADENNELRVIDAAGKTSILLKDFNGQRFNGPNDLWIDKKGGLYFTDPYYQRAYWQRTKPDIKAQSVYYLPAGNQQAIIADSLLVQPNGIVGTPDGKYLFVADIGANKTYRYNIHKDGSLNNRVLFANLGSDGITLDANGNLYLTGKGVTIFDRNGKLIGNIPVPSNWVGNICFGGSNRNMLFITASESIYTLQMLVRGVE